MHARNFRKIMKATWFAQVFPGMAVLTERDTEMEYRTTIGGYRYATSLEGTITGVGADLIIIDDLMKAQGAHFPEARIKVQRFVDEALLTRLDNKRTGRIISIQQRLHEDDVVGHFIE